MSGRSSKRALQAVLCVLGVVALVAGLYGAATGIGGMAGDQAATPSVEGEVRFLSAIWAAYGALALWTARAVRERAPLVRGIAVALFLAGLARAGGWIADGRPHTVFIVLLVLELGVPPLLLLLQARSTAGATPPEA